MPDKAICNARETRGIEDKTLHLFEDSIAHSLYCSQREIFDRSLLFVMNKQDNKSKRKDKDGEKKSKDIDAQRPVEGIIL